jgi:hypothetical protein
LCESAATAKQPHFASRLLWWSAIIGVPQMVPLAFVHSAHQAVVLAVPMGLMGGLGNAALIDLAMRSCPAGLQGTLMMLIASAQMFARRSGNVLRSWIYGLSRDNGFLYCVIVTTAVYALMLSVILLVPKELIATADGEPSPAVEAEVIAEISGTELSL